MSDTFAEPRLMISDSLVCTIEIDSRYLPVNLNLSNGINVGPTSSSLLKIAGWDKPLKYTFLQCSKMVPDTQLNIIDHPEEVIYGLSNSTNVSPLAPPLAWKLGVGCILQNIIIVCDEMIEDNHSDILDHQKDVIYLF